jgi:hypothetical protein
LFFSQITDEVDQKYAHLVSDLFVAFSHAQVGRVVHLFLFLLMEENFCFRPLALHLHQHHPRTDAPECPLPHAPPSQTNLRARDHSLLKQLQLCETLRRSLSSASLLLSPSKAVVVSARGEN